jgi:hypothetical protein
MSHQNISGSDYLQISRKPLLSCSPFCQFLARNSGSHEIKLLLPEAIPFCGQTAFPVSRPFRHSFDLPISSEGIVVTMVRCLPPISWRRLAAETSSAALLSHFLQCSPELLVKVRGFGLLQGVSPALRPLGASLPKLPLLRQHFRSAH